MAEEALARAAVLEGQGKALDAVDVLRAAVFAEDDGGAAAAGGGGVEDRSREQAIYKLGTLLGQLKKADDLVQLSRDIRPFFNSVSKARTAKIVRTLVDVVCEIPDVLPLQIDLCQETVAWARSTKRSFLRQRIEIRLANLYLVSKDYERALDTILKLNREVKKLDDKLLLVDVQLVESRIQHMIHSLPKSKAALTAARTSANAIYCPPGLQVQLDMQSGVLHAEDKDYKTAYSYFFEAFEGLSTIDEGTSAKMAAIQSRADRDQALSASQALAQTKAAAAAAAPAAAAAAAASALGRSQSQVVAQQQTASESPHDAAARALKYMLLCKIMTDDAGDVDAIIASKGALRYAGEGIEAMRALAGAHKNRSLKEFEAAKEDYHDEVGGDEIVRRHLAALYERMLEQNLLRILEPFSVVEVDHIASKVELPRQQVEHKLSQMILDNKLNGILDQGRGHLRLFEETDEDETYVDALGTVDNLATVVDALYDKANRSLAS